MPSLFIRSGRARAIVLPLACLAWVACSDPENAERLPLQDLDAALVDQDALGDEKLPFDAAIESSIDATIDEPSDAHGEVAVDATGDAPSDIALGAVHDTGPDAPSDVATEPTHDAVSEAATDDGSAGSGLSIVFDYRFDDKGAFAPAERKNALQAAAALWSAALMDEFGDIPIGTEVLSRNPENPSVSGEVFVYDHPIDDLVVFVGFATLDGAHGSLATSSPSAAIGSVSDPVLRAQLKQRFEGADFEPWTGWMGFDEAEPWFYDVTPQTSNDIPSDQMDFLSVALHELGHVLGVGTSAAYLALVQNQSFIGTHAVAEHGGPVPLAADGKHIGAGVLSGGKRPVMDSSDAAGGRSEITPLDLAILRDIGYQTSQ